MDKKRKRNERLEEIWFLTRFFGGIILIAAGIIWFVFYPTLWQYFANTATDVNILQTTAWLWHLGTIVFVIMGMISLVSALKEIL